MHRQRVERVAGEDRQQPVELLGRGEAQPGLHRELDAHRVAERAEDGVDALGFTQQAAARALAVDDGRRASQVEVDCGDRVVLEGPGRANQRRDVVADHLRDDRLSRGVLRDRVEDPLLRRRGVVDPEVLGPVDVGAAVLVHQRPERAVGDFLHRRQGEQRRGTVEELVKLLGRAGGRHTRNCTGPRHGRAGDDVRPAPPTPSQPRRSRPPPSPCPAPTPTPAASGSSARRRRGWGSAVP